MLTKEEIAIIDKAAQKTEYFAHWFYGFMHGEMINLDEYSQQFILNAAKRYLEKVGNK